MNEEYKNSLRIAGKIASKVREESKRLIMVGESLLDIAETIEQMITEEGGQPAFPVNISLNEIAAHYTPELDHEIFLTEKDLVKVDLGVSIDDALSDTAYSVDLSDTDPNLSLIKASEDALAEALKTIKAGIKVGDVGEKIENKIRSYGFKPISNLSGHMILPGELHAGIEIPNVKTNDPYVLAEGDVFAVEPFATNGAGYVEDLEQVEIFSLYIPSQINLRQSRKIVEHVLKNYRMLPFAERWIRKEFSSKLLVSAALKELLRNHLVRGYPVLRDAQKGVVAQTEHTILVTNDGCEVLTK